MDPSGYWESAGYFKPGQKIKSATGGMIEVVTSVLDPTPTRVYNFEVAKNQSYAVGELGAWAHNRKILDEDGVCVSLYSNDHAPPHVHVKGGGPETRVGQNLKPILNDPPLAPKQRKVCGCNKNKIAKAIRDAMRKFGQ
ncbi:MAG: DUF4160 domain-containing protein, partial [Hyphomicrobium sp.]